MTIKENDIYIETIDIQKTEQQDKNNIKEVSFDGRVHYEIHKHKAKLYNSNEIDDYIEEINEKVKKIAVKMKTGLQQLKKELKPDELSLDLSFGVSTEGDLIIVKGKASASISVKIKWKL